MDDYGEMPRPEGGEVTSTPARPVLLGVLVAAVVLVAVAWIGWSSGGDDAEAPGDRPATAIARIHEPDIANLVEVDVSTGEIVRELARIDLAGAGIGRIEATDDRRTLFFHQWAADSFQNCDAAVPTLRSVDVAGGSTEAVAVGRGFHPRLSPDETRLAYLTSSRCIDDPDGDDVVWAPFDTLVVRDLVTGSEVSWLDEELAAFGPPPGFCCWSDIELAALHWVDDDRLTVPGREINTELDVRGRRFSADLASVEPTVRYRPSFSGSVLGYDPETDEVLLEDAIGSSGDRTFVLSAVDLRTGEEVEVSRHEAVNERQLSAFSVSEDGALLRLDDGRLVLPDGSSVPFDSEGVSTVDW